MNCCAIYADHINLPLPVSDCNSFNPCAMVVFIIILLIPAFACVFERVALL